MPVESNVERVAVQVDFAQHLAGRGVEGGGDAGFVGQRVVAAELRLGRVVIVAVVAAVVFVRARDLIQVDRLHRQRVGHARVGTGSTAVVLDKRHVVAARRIPAAART